MPSSLRNFCCECAERWMPREIKLVDVIRGSCFTCKKPIGSQFGVRAIPLWLADAEITGNAAVSDP